MTTHHHRKEKNCLNCGAEVTDRFCSHCGQENLPPQETVGHLVQHFVSDITHYDSKFLLTMRDLLFRPGFLTIEYLKGRKIRYLNPVRMYFFISFLFFIVLFAKRKSDEREHQPKMMITNPNPARQWLADSLKKTLVNSVSHSANKKTRDSFIRQIAKNLDTVVVPVVKDESIGFAINTQGFLFRLVELRYNSVE